MSKLGVGNYRILIDGTSRDFLDPQGLQQESLLGLTLSFDQELSDTLGAFVRIGWQQDDAEVDYEAEYSGGLNISGSLWKRPQDALGAGHAYLSGGNSSVGDGRDAADKHRPPALCRRHAGIVLEQSGSRPL